MRRRGMRQGMRGRVLLHCALTAHSNPNRPAFPALAHLHPPTQTYPSTGNRGHLPEVRAEGARAGQEALPGGGAVRARCARPGDGRCPARGGDCQAQDPASGRGTVKQGQGPMKVRWLTENVQACVTRVSVTVAKNTELPSASLALLLYVLWAAGSSWAGSPRPRSPRRSRSASRRRVSRSHRGGGGAAGAGAPRGHAARAAAGHNYNYTIKPAVYLITQLSTLTFHFASYRRRRRCHAVGGRRRGPP